MVAPFSISNTAVISTAIENLESIGIVASSRAGACAMPLPQRATAFHPKQTLDRQVLSGEAWRMDDELEQDAFFELQGPDEHGCVWACSPEGDPNVWCQNLGPTEKVADVLARWLEAIDYFEMETRQ